MKNLFRVLRALLVTLIVVPLATPVILYVALSFDSVRSAIASRTASELTSLLGSDVRIGSVDFAPFNRIVLRNVTVNDSLDRNILTIGHLGAGVSFAETIWQHRPVITYAELIDVSVSLSRDSVGSPLNIAPIIERFKKKDNNGPSSFDLSVNMVVVRRSHLTYDILSAPSAPEGHFDPSHISVSDIRADIRAPRISDSSFEIDLKRMGASESSGLTLTNLSAYLTMDQKEAHLDNLTIELPGSKIAFDNLTLPSLLSPLPRLSSISGRIATLSGSHISTADLFPFVPDKIRAREIIDIEIEAEGSLDRLGIERLSASLRDSETHMSMKGLVGGLTKGRDSISVDLPRLNINVSAPALMQFLSQVTTIPPSLGSLGSLGRVDILASVSASAGFADFDGSIVTDCGNIDLNGSLRKPSPRSPLEIDGIAQIISLNPSELYAPLARLTDISMELRSNLSITPDKTIVGTAEMLMSDAVWKGQRYNNLTADARFVPGHIDLKADSHTPGFSFALSGGYDLGAEVPATELFADIRDIDLSAFLEKGKFKDYSISTKVDISASGIKPDDINGWANISSLTLTSAEGEAINAGDLTIDLTSQDSLHTVSVNSRAIALNLDGEFSYKTIVSDFKNLASQIFPALVPDTYETAFGNSKLHLDVEVKADSLLKQLFNLPIDIVHPIGLKAAKEGGIMSMCLDAPYIVQKNKVIEKTALRLDANANDGMIALTASSMIPTKDGLMSLNLLTTGANDSIDTSIKWLIDRDKDFHGEIDLSTSFSRLQDNRLQTLVRMLPSELVFNDSTWHVYPSTISINPGLITVDNLGGGRKGQSLTINGVASADSLSRVVVDLDHIDLDYIFETLAISDAVMFGGIATGSLYGQALLSKSPVLYTPRLHVDGIAYNNCVMGDADIISFWDNSAQKVVIKADILGKDGSSKINGYIRPASEELVFDFSADNAPVGFMLPFMSAFTSSISGSVSGDAHLYGTFKDLDVKGKIFVDDLHMKLDFTNTTYSVTDSVTLDPGRISFSDVILKDKFGNTAKLSGVVTHKYFHEPEFTFNITDARDMLVYDVSENDTSDPWYGSIFGRGSAKVIGVPGRIDIGVTMTTEPKSTFTFIISDAEESVDYDFIIFHDRDKARKDSLALLDPTPEIIRAIKARAGKKTEGPPSQYVLDFNVDITPEATLNLIMDPIGGDKIVAHGSGHLGMKYDSFGELEMRGDYTLNRGSYSFTLQDIILKDFTIREGSRIRFSGDPYAAQLDITAAYTTKANLSDLDESFLQDPELNRTNVNVNAIMHVNGDMRSPDISYDLEFPSLTSDIDRKVKSIVSTEEMMSQQIIYLLALNRFYTPDYMSATHGNELVSVASSTLSSRLGSMLGALSDTWSIAPSIHSSKGDFSDVEVDVALSSALLDNRLLFNGNLGYRDKSLNNNTFIGDFDIRYLLNRRGTIQLKAYNRYNDQNYYLKNALTTQGIGIVFKRDFDNIFSFLRPKKKNKKEEPAAVEEAGPGNDSE
ncbi:MAG: translocation/assembly module TamB [Muribaculaceae bacterium]|nr:translocation/assembly module TamB [Muribaculaceae bacterium]